jgi:hypothetical protein
VSASIARVGCERFGSNAVHNRERIMLDVVNGSRRFAITQLKFPKKAYQYPVPARVSHLYLNEL